MSSTILIPARKGSQRLKNKNMLPMYGRPMIHWCVAASLKSNVDNVIVSTDSLAVIRYLTKQFNMGDITILYRPKHLAGPSSPIINTIGHVMSIVKETTYLQLVQPTSPLITERHINDVLDKIENTPCAKIMTGCPRCKTSDGMIYIARWDEWAWEWWTNPDADIRILEPWEHVDVNTQEDFDKAEAILEKRNM